MYSPISLKTIDQFDERRPDNFGARFVIVHFEFGNLHIFAAQRTPILPKFTVIGVFLQPSAARFMLYLQHIISTRNRPVLSLEIETISGYKFMKEQQRNFRHRKAEKYFK
jgi:hypothetical protein